MCIRDSGCCVQTQTTSHYYMSNTDILVKLNESKSIMLTNCKPMLGLLAGMRKILFSYVKKFYGDAKKQQNTSQRQHNSSSKYTR